MKSGLLILKYIFFLMHRKFAIDDMFHLNFTYSNILDSVIHKMNMNLNLLVCKYWASGLSNGCSRRAPRPDPSGEGGILGVFKLPD